MLPGYIDFSVYLLFNSQDGLSVPILVIICVTGVLSIQIVQKPSESAPCAHTRSSLHRPG